MDISVIIEHIPAALAALAAFLGGSWALFKFIAPFTKSTKDDEFIASHGEQVEDVLEKMEDDK